jgi:hypothetical protein
MPLVGQNATSQAAALAQPDIWADAEERFTRSK